MRAMVLHQPAPATDRPLTLEEIEDPRPKDDEVRVEVSVCGVCRTDLHVIEADLALPKLPIVPGHEIVGRVVETGAAVRHVKRGARVGVAWVNRFCGVCDPCVEQHENLCHAPTFTGYHVNGGYAERVVAPAAFVYPLPDGLGEDARIAPLLCAGIIGYRALKRSGLVPGHRIGLYGFGGSAHIALQVAKAWGCEVFVVSRTEESLERARRLGADWTGLSGERPPRRLQHAVSFAPAGSVIPEALSALDRGGTLALAGIYVDRIPELDYDRHLFQERALVSVTANARTDGRELMEIASHVRIETDIQRFGLEDAGEALVQLKEDRLEAQAAVLEIGGR